MTWAIEVKLDPGREECGTITATWTAVNGSTFVFPKRHLCSESDQPKFMLLAEAALQTWLGKDAKEKEISSTMTTAANRVH